MIWVMGKLDSMYFVFCPVYKYWLLWWYDVCWRLTVSLALFLQSSATYWEGKADAESLQRIYGISFPDPKQLKEWKHFQEEAAKRDHRKIGKVRCLIWLSCLIIWRTKPKYFWNNKCVTLLCFRNKSCSFSMSSVLAVVSFYQKEPIFIIL